MDRIRPLKAFHTILPDSPMNHNQIYAEPEDYDFVLDYITKRCVSAKGSHGAGKQGKLQFRLTEFQEREKKGSKNQ